MIFEFPSCISRFVDAVMTIPKGTLFPMCGMNLGFNRELIGPAMYFGLMGDGQPIGRYDDMWAGWCTKVYIVWWTSLCLLSSLISLLTCLIYLYYDKIYTLLTLHLLICR